MTSEGADAPLGGTSVDATRLPAHLALQRTPYVILAGIQLAAALLCLGFVLPGLSSGANPLLYVTIAIALAVSSALTWLVLPRVPRDLGIDISLTLVYVMAFGAMLATPTDEGQVLIGLGLSVFGVFAAYFLPRRRLRWSLVIMLVLYAVGEMLNPEMSTVGVPLMVVGVIIGVSLLVGRLVARLRDVALHDPLTGLLNRRGLDLLAPPVLAACARSSTTVTVGLLDLDDFKAYNDAHGHLAGDQLLTQVSAAWRGALRDSDLAARFGGDELAVVLVGSTRDEAEAIARRACNRPQGECLWTIGWATLADGESFYDALGRADDRLLAAKSARRTGR